MTQALASDDYDIDDEDIMLKRSLADGSVTTDYGEGPLPTARPTADAML